MAVSVNGLVELLQELHIKQHLSAAASWCDEAGVVAVEDIVTEDLEQDFIGALMADTLSIKKAPLSSIFRKSIRIRIKLSEDV